MKTQSLLNAGVLSLTVLFAGCAAPQYNPKQCVGFTERTVGIPYVVAIFQSRDSFFTDKNCNFSQALGILPFAEMTEKGTLNRAYFTIWHREYTKLLEERRALALTNYSSDQDRINELQRMIETTDHWTKEASGGKVTSGQLLAMFANNTLNPDDVVLNANSVPPSWKYEPQNTKPVCTGTGVRRICTAPVPANTNAPNAPFVQ